MSRPRVLPRLAPIAAVTLGALTLGVACTVGVTANDGVDEPFQVEGGQFIQGDLPTSDAGPRVVSVNTEANYAFAGQAGKALTGDVSDGGVAVLMRLGDLGTGYWSVPVGGPDTSSPGDYAWAATVDFGFGLAPATYMLNVTAIDADGVPGPITQNPFLVQSSAPTGAVVVSLRWDSNADLDLHVQTPTGDLSPKNPTTSMDGGLGGVIDRDSNANCVEDGFREEDAVWASPPTPGTYLVSVDMFSACGAPSADFVLTVRVGGAVTNEIPGRLLATDADNGGPGLFLLQLTF